MKESIKFREPELCNNVQILFVLDESSLSDWLSGLLRLDSNIAADKLHCLIEALKTTQLPICQKQVFLDMVFEHMKHFSERVDNANLKNTFPLPESKMLLVEKIVWCYLGLAHGFCSVAKQSGEKKLQILVWYQALFALSQAYLFILSVYCAPGKGFWHMCYFIYYAAEKTGGLYDLMPDLWGEGESIDKLFKQLIVLSFSDTNQFRADEMKVVFFIIGKYTTQIVIDKSVKSDKKKGTFIFDLNQDKQAVRLFKFSDVKALDKVRSIEPMGVAKIIFESLLKEKAIEPASKSVNYNLLIRLIEILGVAQSRQFSREPEASVFRGVMGFDSISNFLKIKKANKDLVVEEVEDEIELELELLPLGEETQYFSTLFKDEIGSNEQLRKIFKLSAEERSAQGVWDSEAPPSDKPLADRREGHEFSLLDSSAKGYGIGWKNHEAGAKLGEIFGIVSEDSARLEIALVRRIVQQSAGVMQLGLEVVGFESELVKVKKEENKSEKWCIVLPAVKAQGKVESLVFKIGDFQANELIILERNEETLRCRLTKVLNLTPSVMQMELVHF